MLNGTATNPVFQGIVKIQNTNSAAFTNDDIAFGGRGEIVMPSADWSGEDENTWGGRLIWDFKGGGRSYPQGSSGSPLGFLGMFNYWGGKAGYPSGNPWAILTCGNVRLEEGWALPAGFGGQIHIGNEDHFGSVQINYTPLYNSGFLSLNTLGRSHALAFETVYTVGSGGYNFSSPGIQGVAGGPGTVYGPGGDTRTLGELWFFTGTPIPNSTSVSNVWSAYPGVVAAKMHTNNWEFVNPVFGYDFTATNSMRANTSFSTLGYGGSFFGTNLVQIGAGALALNKVAGGLDVSSGLQPGIMLGADNNALTRTDATDKTFYMSMSPRTNANASHTIMTGGTSSGFPFLTVGGGTSTLAPVSEIDFYAATGPIFATGAGNLQMSIVDGAVQIYTRFRLTGTVTAAGTTTTQTINKPCGTVNFPAAAATVTVNNSLVTVDSIITCVVMANDTTALLKNVVPSAGSFVIRLNANTTAETKVGFVVHNPN